MSMSYHLFFPLLLFGLFYLSFYFYITLFQDLTCAGEYDQRLYPDCQNKIDWMLRNWDAVEISKKFVHFGVDGSKCSIMRYLATVEGPYCPYLNSSLLVIPSTYRLKWQDRFDVDGLVNEAYWEYETYRNKAGWYNNELQYYTRRRAENAVVFNKTLIITARKEFMYSEPDYGHQNYTSARLSTRGKLSWLYGFVEIRAKLPCGHGVWPAIWMMAVGDNWPDDGEVDIMEHDSHDPSRVIGAVHNYYLHGGDGPNRRTLVPDNCLRFHKYQLHWTPERIQVAVDGRIFFVYSKDPTFTDDDKKIGQNHDIDRGRGRWPFSARGMYLILNLAVGGDLGGTPDEGNLPVSLLIDYVRVYQL